MKSVTLKDIAKKLDVHHSTVSRALKNHPDVSKQTQELILKTARDMEYSPNLAAAALRSGKMDGLLISVPVDGSKGASNVLASVACLTSRKECPKTTILMDSDGSHGTYAKQIIISFDEDLDREKILALAPQSQRMAVVAFNYAEQTRRAAMKLLDQGLRQLGLVNSPFMNTLREDVFNSVLLDRFIPVRSKNVVCADAATKDDEDAIRGLFSGFESPDGVVVASAESAILLGQLADVIPTSSIICLENDPILKRLFPTIARLDFDVETALDSALNWVMAENTSETAKWIDVDLAWS